MYPFRTDEEQHFAEEVLPRTRYASDDTPHLSTARYSLNSDYEPRDVVNKAQLDMQGAKDNLYWYEFTKLEDRINRSAYV